MVLFNSFYRIPGTFEEGKNSAMRSDGGLIEFLDESVNMVEKRVLKAGVLINKVRCNSEKQAL